MKRQTLETAIAQYLSAYPETQSFRVRAHGLLHDGDSWSSNDRFTILSEGSKAAVLTACRGRWEVFKANYCPRARVADIQDIGYNPENGVLLECDFLPFVDIEPV